MARNRLRRPKKLEPLDTLPGLRVMDFCRRFQISRPTWYDWKDKGIIDPVRVGSFWIVPMAQVKKLMGDSP